MEIALVGAGSYLLDGIIDKLSKEGHRLYHLTGHDYATKKLPKVFEQYNFSYANDAMPQVFESIRPDAVIFMGQFDTNFPAQAQQRHVLEYSGGLVNILTSLSNLNKKVRFIYLSSERVYEVPNDMPYPEDYDTNPVGERERMVRQGERTVENYNGLGGLDAMVLRLDHVYGVPNGRNDMPDLFYDMCRQAIFEGEITANSNHEFSLLYVNDAVEYVHLALTTESHNEVLYHVSSGNVYTEVQLAQWISQGMEQEVKVREQNVGQRFRLLLEGGAFRDEFQTRVFGDASKQVPRIASEIRHHAKRYYDDKTKSEGRGILKQLAALFWKIIPFLENFAAFLIFFYLFKTNTDSDYFANLDFLLLYVILFAVIFGQQQATISAILSSIGYVYIQQYDRSGFDVAMDYNTYVWIAQIFIVGLVVGYLKDRLTSIRAEDKIEIDYLEQQRTDISDINTTNVKIKNVLEQQIVNQSNSFGKVYSITSSLDQYEPEEVLFYAAEIVERLMESGDVAIYTVANGDYARLFASTSQLARSLGNSMKYTDYDDMYEDFKNERVFINKEMSPEKPLMADAIYSEGKMKLIVCVWGLPWDRMNLGEANMLRIIGYLIQNAVVRAENYMAALEQQRYLEGSRTLQEEAFSSLVRAFLNAQQRGLTITTVVHVQIASDSEEKNQKIEVASKFIRATDYFGQLSNGEYYVLLSNTDEESASFVINRFGENGIEADVVPRKELYALVEEDEETAEDEVTSEDEETENVVTTTENTDAKATESSVVVPTDETSGEAGDDDTEISSGAAVGATAAGAAVAGVAVAAATSCDKEENSEEADAEEVVSEEVVSEEVNVVETDAEQADPVEEDEPAETEVTAEEDEPAETEETAEEDESAETEDSAEKAPAAAAEVPVEEEVVTEQETLEEPTPLLDGSNSWEDDYALITKEKLGRRKQKDSEKETATKKKGFFFRKKGE